jgi:hypothetical protein
MTRLLLKDLWWRKTRQMKCNLQYGTHDEVIWTQVCPYIHAFPIWYKNPNFRNVNLAIVTQMSTELNFWIQLNLYFLEKLTSWISKSKSSALFHIGDSNSHLKQIWVLRLFISVKVWVWTFPAFTKYFHNIKFISPALKLRTGDKSFARFDGLKAQSLKLLIFSVPAL